MPSQTYSVEEVDLKDFPNDGDSKSCKMYLLILGYSTHKFQPYMTNFFCTDYTDNIYGQIPRIGFGPCVNKNGFPIEADKVIMFEIGTTQTSVFINKYNLPQPTFSPNLDVYPMKVIVEINGTLKRYRNGIDYRRGFISYLTKTDIIKKVRLEKDKHLIDFLSRLQQNCPATWRTDLYERYGLDEISDDIGSFYANIEAQEFITQNFTTAESQQISPHQNKPVRLLNEMPKPTEQSYDNIPDSIRDITRQILKTEAPSPKRKNDSYSQVSPNASQSHSNSRYNETQQRSKIAEAIPIVLDSQESSFSEEDTDALAVGYSFGEEDNNFIVTDPYSQKLQFLDTFELYLKLRPESQTIHTLGFKTPEAVCRFILGTEVVANLNEKNIPTREELDEKFCQKKVSIDANVLSLFQGGADEVYI